MVREAFNAVTGRPMTILQYQPREIDKVLLGFSIAGVAKAGGHLVQYLTAQICITCPIYEITNRQCHFCVKMSVG